MPSAAPCCGKERIYHSHTGGLEEAAGHRRVRPGGKKEKSEKSSEAAELARLRAANKKLEAKNDELTRDLGKTKTALDIAGRAFALLEDISSSADSGGN